MTALVLGDVFGAFTYKAAEELFELFSGDREKAMEEQKKITKHKLIYKKHL